MPFTVSPVDVRAPAVLALVDALTAELAAAGYADDEMFGYSPDQLERSVVHLVGAQVEGGLAGIGGVEVQDGDIGELKRMFVVPACRGTGAADALMAALVEHAREHGVRVLRLETGDQQHAAIGFYRRHGFAEVPRFPPYVDSASSVCMQRDL